MAAINPVIDLILQYCGFATAPGCVLIVADGFGLYEDILSLADKDVSDLVKGFAGRTVANG
mgnify:CR=1 FL=1